ncbi:disulfide bond formation protein DsbA [Spiractinospora alimapuensis]|uniref:mycothiol-dependent nitroreductase Rv2466c family protein n=1 Tax=Spiractinospora alimapuensis TaxID=2820884 RepID=UPI001F2B7EEF|nr:disulfide bond formation protein DsbA [Spiractinospora alimapuensis]QVQ52829.1 disulfide bond formation protein DsbA [Spiractinospora alimapuensis]
MAIADFWFDPSCPYTQLTAQWMTEVEAVRPVRVRWRAMSLSVLNEHRDDDPEGDPDGYLWIAARICAAVQCHHGHDALGRFYAALWPHNDAATTMVDTDTGDVDWLAGLRDALRVAGLPTDLAEVGLGTDYDDELRRSHTEGVTLLGPHVGTPIIATPHPTTPDTQVAFFGPVISQVPRGEAAGRLWDATLLVAATPGFHTLKGHAPGAA